MIARIRFDLHGSPAEAVLSDDAEWTCPDPAIGGLLNDLLRGADRSPAAGIPYRGHASDAADLLGGTVEFGGEGEGEGPPPGAVY